MSSYTKNGDRGTTDLFRTKNVSKSDDRIQLVGAVDELNCHLGLLKTMIEDKDTIRILEKIQDNLDFVMAGVSDPYSKDYKLNEDKTEILEAEIERLEGLFESPAEPVRRGVNRLSAQIDVARAVARRAERALVSVSVKFGADTGAKKYMNRLADYLDVLARYAEADGMAAMGHSEAAHDANSIAAAQKAARSVAQTGADMTENTTTVQQKISQSVSGPSIDEAIIQEVLKRMGIQLKINLDTAKRLIERVEAEALRRGSKAVIAICGPDGNPVAVHVMDGAFLVSFDAAMKKAYTSVAVKMSTMEFGKMAQPGGTFYGADKLDNGKIVIFGGGVPIKAGDNIVGGIGVSGGTGEEDHSLAEYGASVYRELM